MNVFVPEFCIQEFGYYFNARDAKTSYFQGVSQLLGKWVVKFNLPKRETIASKL
ncbi:MAG: hypothetical protein [Olavius algarvensis Gamma 3 endosymbiont]|nr:MAG: hypothetical protein [Olavius algarvensis Gamma 3 endosymbiont]